MELNKLSNDNRIEKWVKDEVIRLGLPSIGRPPPADPDKDDPLKMPSLRLPTNLMDLPLRDLGALKTQWSSWMLHAGYLLSVTRVKEAAKKEEYEELKKMKMAEIQEASEKKITLDVLEGEALKRYPELTEIKDKYYFAYAMRLYLGGHPKSKNDYAGGIVSFYTDGVDIISRIITMKELDFEQEKRFGSDGTGQP